VQKSGENPKLTMSQSKPKVIKDFDKMDEALQEQIKLTYPNGFVDHLIRFTNKDGKLVSALPFETDEKYYLVRMTASEAKELIRDDTDYDGDGNLKEDIRDEYEDKYADLDYMQVGGSKPNRDEDEAYD